MNLRKQLHIRVCNRNQFLLKLYFDLSYKRSFKKKKKQQNKTINKQTKMFCCPLYWQFILLSKNEV